MTTAQKLPRIATFVTGFAVAFAVLGGASTISVSDTEINAGGTPTTMSFPVSRAGDTSYDVYVGYRTADGSAEAGTDFTAVEGILRVPSGAASGTIQVGIAASPGGGPAKSFQLFLDSAIGAGSTPGFSAASHFPVGDDPFAVATGDVNGDGKPDLAVANRLGNGVSVLVNATAPGALTPSYVNAVEFSVGADPFSLAFGDVNGDGRPDLVVANRFSNDVSVLLNTTAPGVATPSYASAVNFLVGGYPQSVAMGDVNGDGKADLVVADGNSVVVLLNTTMPGADTPSFASAVGFLGGGNPQRLALGDINGDGKLDVVAANGTYGIAVLLNTTAPGATTPSFAGAVSFPIDSSNYGSPQHLALADLNGDGRIDVATSNPGHGKLSVWLNTTVPGATTPGFATPVSFPSGVPGSQGLAAGDVNGDGKPDLATAGSNTVGVLLNTTATGSTTPSFATAVGFAAGSGGYAVAMGDLNGDGRSDLAVAKPSANNVSVLHNTTVAGAAMPSYAGAIHFSVGDNPYAAALSDVNGDGMRDLAVANRRGNSISVLLNREQAVDLGSALATGTIYFPPPPVVNSVARASASPTNSTSVAYTVTFSKSVTGVDKDDFALTVTDVSDASITFVSGAGATRTVTVATGSGNGTLRLDVVDNDSILAADDGQPLGGAGLGNGSFQGGEVYTLDKAGPTVTVEQGAAQVDPADTSPVTFDVQFSEAVSGFTATDVLLSGTAMPTTAVISGGPSVYVLSVSGMSANGTVIASVAAGGATDTVGNVNLASTSSDNVVTYQAFTPDVGFTLSAQTITEGTGASTTVVVTATLNQSSTLEVTAPVTVSADSTATADDYTLGATQLTFPPGTTTANITATITPDALDEPDETLILGLGAPINATVGVPSTQTINIIDDDEPPSVTLGRAGSPLAENGGVATVTATLSAVSGRTVVVNLAYGGTATNGVDYVHSGTQVVIAAGATSGSVTITGVDDAELECDETVIVSLGVLSNATAGASSNVIATITDDEIPGPLNFICPLP